MNIKLKYLFLFTSIFMLSFFCINSFSTRAAEKKPTTTATKKTLYAGYKNYQIRFNDLPAASSVTYKSSSNKVASVSKTGVVTPLKKGTATITVTIKSGTKTYTSKIAITIKNPYLQFVKKTKYLALKSVHNTYETDSFTFLAKAVGVKNPKLIYSIDQDIAIINETTGVFVGRNLGDLTVTVTDQTSGLQASCLVSIIREEESREAVLTLDGKYAYYGYYPQSKLTAKQITKEIKNADFDNHHIITIKGISYIRMNHNSNQNSGKSEYEYFVIEPIKWRVLKETDSSYLLLSEYNLESHSYSKQGKKSSTWANSELRSWLNGIEEFEKEGDSFLFNAFSLQERDALLSSKIDGVTNKVFILSANDAKKAEYGFSTSTGKHDSRVCASTPYALSLGAYYLDNKNSWWWLRSVGQGSSYLTDGGTAFVYGGGKMELSGMPGDNGSFGVRPVIKVSKNAVTIKK